MNMISLKFLSSRIKGLKAFAVAAMVLSGLGFGGAQAQPAVVGTATPASTTASQPVSLSLDYSGFTVQNIGYQFRVYFDSAQLTFVSATNGAAPAGAYQGDSGAVIDTLNGDGVAATNRYVELSWVDLGNSWPTAPAGKLATISFTTTAAFAGTSVSLRESATGPRVRNVPGTAVPIAFTAPPAPTVSVAASLAALNDSPGNVSTLTFTSSAAAPVGGFSVNITPATANARYTTSCVSPIVITAGNTTATCTVTATANTTPGDGTVTATTTILAGAGYAVGATPSAAVSVNDDDVAPTVRVAAAPTTLSNNTGGSSTVTFTSSAAATAGGLSVTFTPPAANAQYTTTCVSPILITAGNTTATCLIAAVTPPTTNATAIATVTITGGSPATYSIAAAPNNSASVTVTATVPTVTVAAAPTSITTGGVSTVTFTASTAPVGALVISVTPPTPNALFSTTCGSTITITAPATTATCTITALAGAGSVTALVSINAGARYVVGVPSSASVQVGFVPILESIPVPTISPVALALLTLMIFGFVAFGQRRRINK